MFSWWNEANAFDSCTRQREYAYRLCCNLIGNVKWDFQIRIKKFSVKITEYCRNPCVERLFAKLTLVTHSEAHAIGIWNLNSSNGDNKMIFCNGKMWKCQQDDYVKWSFLYLQWSISHHTANGIHILNEVVQNQKWIIYVVFVFGISIQVEHTIDSFDMVACIFREINRPRIIWCWWRVHGVICKSFELIFDSWLKSR